MRRYLIVDDNRAFAENLSEILRDQGDEVAVVGNGALALAAVKAQTFNAMITDMRMPVMGGAQLVHEVRRVDPGLPAIVVTAYTQENDLSSARQEGLLAVLPKPVPIHQLLVLLNAARRLTTHSPIQLVEGPLAGWSLGVVGNTTLLLLCMKERPAGSSPTLRTYVGARWGDMHRRGESYRGKCHGCYNQRVATN